VRKSVRRQDCCGYNNSVSYRPNPPRRCSTPGWQDNEPLRAMRQDRPHRSQVTGAPTLWLADLTYSSTGEGSLYLATVLDLHTRKIVGWCVRPILHVEIALEALDVAMERQRPASGLITTPIAASSTPRKSTAQPWRDKGSRPQRAAGATAGTTPRWNVFPTQGRAGRAPGLRHARPGPPGFVPVH
jgi:transposase InsO family protein